MKVKTSITLSRDLLEALDAQAVSYKSRSDFIEAALRAFVAQAIRTKANARDLETINRKAGRLNREALDVLAYQVIP